VVLVAYGLDMVVVVSVGVVSVGVASVVVVSMVEASVDVVSVVVSVVVDVVVAVVVPGVAGDVVVVDDVVGTSGADGVSECREVCKTAATSMPTTTRPATPAANTAQGRSYHCSAAGAAGRSSAR